MSVSCSVTAAWLRVDRCGAGSCAVHRAMEARHGWLARTLRSACCWRKDEAMASQMVQWRRCWAAAAQREGCVVAAAAWCWCVQVVQNSRTASGKSKQQLLDVHTCQRAVAPAAPKTRITSLTAPLQLALAQPCSQCNRPCQAPDMCCPHACTHHSRPGATCARAVTCACVRACPPRAATRRLTPPGAWRGRRKSRPAWTRPAGGGAQ